MFALPPLSFDLVLTGLIRTCSVIVKDGREVLRQPLLQSRERGQSPPSFALCQAGSPTAYRASVGFRYLLVLRGALLSLFRISLQIRKMSNNLRRLVLA